MSKLVEKIRALRAAQAAKLDAYEALSQKTLDEDRAPSDDELATRNTLKAELETTKREIERLEEDERILATKAVPAIAPPGPITVPAQPSRMERDAAGRIVKYGIPALDDYKGAGWTRYMIARAGGGAVHAGEFARERWGEEFGAIVKQYEIVARTLTPEKYDQIMTRAVTPPMSSGEAVGSGGSSTLIVVLQMGSEFIELLRPLLLVGRVPNMRQINFGGAGRLNIPRQIGGVTGAYIGEGSSIIVQRMTFDQIALTPSKLAVISPVTNELLRRSNPSMEMLMRDDMVAGTARTIDAAFIASVAAPPAPNGILTYSAALAGGAIAAAATATAIVAALRAMLTALQSANVPQENLLWIFNPRTIGYIRLVQAATVEVFPFKSEVDGGTLLGIPYISSTSVPITGTAPGTCPYVLLNTSNIIFADDLPPTIDASEEAMIQNDSAPGTPPVAPYVSAFQQDLTLLRMRMSHSWAVRHAEAIVWGVSSV